MLRARGQLGKAAIALQEALEVAVQALGQDHLLTLSLREDHALDKEVGRSSAVLDVYVCLHSWGTGGHFVCPSISPARGQGVKRLSSLSLCHTAVHPSVCCFVTCLVGEHHPSLS